MRDAGMIRAAERVDLACKALSAAVADLHVARDRDDAPVGDTVEKLNTEVERVCELAHELERCAERLGLLTGALG
jgi:hypothetical protein